MPGLCRTLPRNATQPLTFTMERINYRTIASIVVLVVTIFALGARPAYSWDKYAHEIVAQIAYDRLTPTAKAQAAMSSSRR